jgi:hypothetical protein
MWGQLPRILAEYDPKAELIRRVSDIAARKEEWMEETDLK